MTKVLLRSLALASVILLLWVPSTLAQGPETGRVIVGQDFVLDAGQLVDGDLVVLGGDADVRQGSTVQGNVAVLGGDLRIAGTATGDVATFGGDIALARDALVEGDVIAVGGSVTQETGARVVGESFSVLLPLSVLRPELIPEGLRGPGEEPVRRSDSGMILLWPLKALAVSLAMALVGGALALFAPRGLDRVSEALGSEPVTALAIGIVTLLTGVATGLVLLIACCFGLLVWLLLACAVFFGWTAAGIRVGQALVRMLRVEDSTGLLAAASGVFLLTLVSRLPLCVGGIFGLIVASMGLGAVVLTHFGMRNYPLSPLNSVEPRGLPRSSDNL